MGSGRYPDVRCVRCEQKRCKLLRHCGVREYITITSCINEKIELLDYFGFISFGSSTLYLALLHYSMRRTRGPASERKP